MVPAARPSPPPALPRCPSQLALASSRRLGPCSKDPDQRRGRTRVQGARRSGAHACNGVATLTMVLRRVAIQSVGGGARPDGLRYRDPRVGSDVTTRGLAVFIPSQCRSGVSPLPAIQRLIKSPGRARPTGLGGLCHTGGWHALPRWRLLFWPWCLRTTGRPMP